jgi:tetratricopeptide (TPR) repeat protein
MKTIKIALFAMLSIGVLALSACKSEKDKQYEEIVAIEKSLFGDRTSFNDSIARVYLNKVQVYVDSFKDDQHRAELLFKSGEVLNGLGSYSFAIRKFQDLIGLYPNDPRAAESMFLCAFIYDTYLQNYDDAGRYYKMFLKKYPNHQLAKDAKISLDNLGKTPEELVKEFEKKNALN